MDIDTFEGICASHGDPIAVWEPETHPLRWRGRYPFCSAPDPVKIAVWKIDDKYEGGILVGCTWHEGPPHQWHVNAGHRQAIAHLMGLIAAVEAERDSLRADLADARQCLSMFTDDPRSDLARITADPVVIPELTSSDHDAALARCDGRNYYTGFLDGYEWLRSRLRTVQPGEVEDCEWHPDDIPGAGVRGWKTACGEAMYPKHRWRIGEDGLNFCPNCGKRAVQVSGDEWAARSAHPTTNEKEADNGK